MTPLTLKWAAASIIFGFSLISGFASLHLTAKYQKYIQIGDAVANGIFIGAAIFHMFPNAIEMFRNVSSYSPVAYSIAISAISFLILALINQLLNKFSSSNHACLAVSLVVTTLSIHAFIGGVALGLSEIISMAWIIFFAILFHKGFEVFALVVSLQQRMTNSNTKLAIFVIFSLITPLGIWAGLSCTHLFQLQVDSVLTAVFNAFAAGTFLYMGLIDQQQNRSNRLLENSYHQYSRLLATFSGIAVMAIVGVWV